jgi:hypothetical protein
MLQHPLLRPSLVAALLLLLVPWGWNQTGLKKKVTSETDLPRFNYPVRGSASELVEADDATFNAFAAKVRADLDSVFRDYDLADKSMLRTLLAAKLNLQELAGQYPEALSTVDAIKRNRRASCSADWLRAPCCRPKSTAATLAVPRSSRLSAGIIGTRLSLCLGMWFRIRARPPMPARG